MSAVKHTPTPWKIGAHGDICHGRGEWSGIKLHTGWAEDVWREDAEAEANARFIVHTANCHYDMLEALKQLCDRLGPQWFLAEGWAAPLDAIAKAEGREASE